jgi:hypothetical protein
MFNYLIRVHLPDRPGALGAVASRIGSVGGDVVSIDILQREDGIVVDELGVGLAGDNLIDLLSDEILEVDGVSIESVRPIVGPMPDRGSELLEVATELFEQTSGSGLLELLTVRVRRGLVATFAGVIDADSSAVVTGDGWQPGRDLLSGGVGERPDLAVAPMAEAGLILVVVRDDPVLRHRERQWISTMAQLADRSWQVLS